MNRYELYARIDIVRRQTEGLLGVVEDARDHAYVAIHLADEGRPAPCPKLDYVESLMAGIREEVERLEAMLREARAQ